MVTTTKVRTVEVRDYTATVTLKRLVKKQHLDEDDKSLQDSYRVPFWAPSRSSQDTLREIALDEFHNTIPISVLEHFDIDVTEIKPEDESPNASSSDKEAQAQTKD